MLGKYLKINGTLMPNPIAWADNINPDETVYFSEGGKRMINVKRLDRITFTASFNCTSKLKEQLDTLVKTPKVSVQFNNGTAITGTLRRASEAALVENSQYCNGTNGLWTVSLIFEGD